MKRAIKTIMAMLLAFAIAFTCVPQTAEAATKITTVGLNKNKAVQTKLYKGAGKHTAKVKFTDATLVQSYQGFNIYHVGITVKNTKLTQEEANGLSREYRKKFFSNWYSTDVVITDSQGNDLLYDKRVGISDFSAVRSGQYKKTSNYTRGYLRYRDTFRYARTVTYSFYLYVPAYETDVYVGIAGLKNGQPSASKGIQYSYGNISFRSAGFGGKKQYCVATKLQQ